MLLIALERTFPATAQNTTYTKYAGLRCHKTATKLTRTRHPQLSKSLYEKHKGTSSGVAIKLAW